MGGLTRGRVRSPPKKRGIPLKRARSRNFYKPGLIVLIIYNTAAGELCSKKTPPLRITLFLKIPKNQENLWKPIEFEPSVFSQKFTSRTLTFFLSHVCGETDGPRKRCRTSAVVLTFLFFKIKVCRQGATVSTYPAQFLPLTNTYYKTQLSWRILTKHMVRLRCRCSCETDRTSAVPLLVISETSVKPS